MSETFKSWPDRHGPDIHTPENAGSGSERHGGLAVLGVFAFSCGVILLYCLSILPPPEYVVATILLLSLGVVRSPSRARSRCLILVSCLLLGLSWSAWQARERLSAVLPSALERQPLEISGYLCGLPTDGSFRSLRFSFCVTAWHHLPQTPAMPERLPDLVRLAWYGHAGEALPGHRLRLRVVLKRPHGTLNPEGFRYEDWLFRKGFRATGSVRDAQRDSAVPCGVHCQYRLAYQQLNDWVEARFGQARQFPLISSLLTGHRGHLTQSHWETLKATGTIHLVAISGLHLGLVALGAGFVCRRLILAVSAGRLDQGLERRLIFAAVMLSCLTYALAAGFTVPTRRALVMVVVGGWLLVLGRQAPVWQSFVVALGMVLLLDPFAPLDQGFWLSFTAVAVLITAFSSRLAGSGWLSGLVVAQAAVFAGLWPVLVAFGHGQPLAGLVANLIAIPWVSVVVMPVLVSGALLTALVPGAAEALVPLFDAVLGLLWAILTWLQSWQLPELSASGQELALLALLAALLILAPFTGFRLAVAALAAAWLVSLPNPALRNPLAAEPEVRVWDVGQGLSVLIHHGRKVMVYDTGPAVPGVFSAVESTLLPNLRARGIERIDTLVVSHADNDHAGGLAQLVSAMPVGRLIAGEVSEISKRLPEVPVQPCRAKRERFAGLMIDYWRAGGDAEGNDASCVVRIFHAASRTEWLIPGDISSDIETRYLRDVAASALAVRDVRTRVVIAPHHGSDSSSSERWVSSLKPQWVIYTAGYRHRYGHPHPEVTARYRRQGAGALNTACSGSVLTKITGNRLVISELRHQAPFWIGGPGLARDQCKIP